MEKIIKCLWKWILEHLAYTQGLLVLSVTVISAISGITKNYLVLIVALLVFVGTEFTVITLGYLEPIQKKIDARVGKDNVAELVINDNLQWKDLVQNASHDIFLSGVTLGSLYQERRIFQTIPENVQVNILVHDTIDDDVTKTYCTVCKPKASFQSLKDKQTLFRMLAKDLAGKTNVMIKMTKNPLYIQFVGCDVFTESKQSFIRAQHCLRKNLTGGPDEIDDKLIFGTNKKSDLFRLYKNQILILWNDSTKYVGEKPE